MADALQPGDERELRPDLSVRAFRTHHTGPSLGYQFFSRIPKLKPEYLDLPGKEIAIRNARDAMSHRISLVPEDRKRLGLILIQTILKNMSLPNLNRFSGFMYIDQNAELAAVMKSSTSLAIKAPSVQVPVESLSGGNQQKVVISKWLMSEPRILILDDPTRGVDVGAKYEIYKLMNQLAEGGFALNMISSELGEVLGMSDRVLVMWEGRSNGTLEIGAADQETIMARATGIELAAG